MTNRLPHALTCKPKTTWKTDFGSDVPSEPHDILLRLASLQRIYNNDKKRRCAWWHPPMYQSRRLYQKEKTHILLLRGVSCSGDAEAEPCRSNLPGVAPVQSFP